ncbi:UPF0280 family protein [candidate division KSB1 bacterium]|nr:UPF0280 family protein [candidate division KSB1 bacterium]
MNQNSFEYIQRTYRNNISTNSLTIYNISFKETDLFISTDSDLSEIAFNSVHGLRFSIESYIVSHPDFLTSLCALPYDEFAPKIIRDMLLASAKAGVGPMASVAGSIAEHVGWDLMQYSENVIIENGGDIFLKSIRDIDVGLFAGRSLLTDRVSIKVTKEETPIGICTSSGTVGHSLSFGCSDACCVKSKSVALADAAATAIANSIKPNMDLKNALNMGMKIEGVRGIVIIAGGQMGVTGDIELVKR